MAPRKPKVIRTLEQLRRAFDDPDVRKYWVVCIDNGGHFLRYVGPNKPGFEPSPPLELDLQSSPGRLLAEALELAGIPAERA